VVLSAIGCGGRSQEHTPSAPNAGAGTAGTGGLAGAASQVETAGTGGTGAMPEGGTPSDECASDDGLVLGRAPDASPPRVMLVLDASAASTVSAPYNGSVWDNTVTAVHQALLSLPDGLPLGVRTFPDVQARGQTLCTAALRAPLARLDATTRADVDHALIDGGDPDGVRDLYQGYTLATGDLRDDAQPPHAAILLVTTGLPTHDAACTPFDAAPTGEELAPLFDSVALAERGRIDTFVLGSYGSGDAADVLSELAVSGGTALEPCHDRGADNGCHLDASQTDDVSGTLTAYLESAVQTELERAGCKLTLPAAGTLPGLLALSLVGDQGERPLGEDSAGSSCPGGWYYTPLDETDTDGSGAIALCGQACLDYLADPSAHVVIRCSDRRLLPVK